MDREAIAEVFDRCFAECPHPLDRARMVRGGDEPLFLPASRFRPIGEVVYARGLAASCLHEAAHWLRAGRARRCLVDYGYWYLPDGRDAPAQAEFEQREAEVQGLEWILAASAGVPFRVSCDNLERPDPGLDFCAAIAAVAERRIAAGLPTRAARLANALAAAASRRLPSAPPLAQSLRDGICAEVRKSGSPDVEGDTIGEGICPEVRKSGGPDVEGAPRRSAPT